MKKEVKITELTIEEISDFLSTALYGNSSVYSDYENLSVEGIFDDDDCYEDKLAKILVSGGSIIIGDMESDFEDGITSRLLPFKLEIENRYGETFSIPGYRVKLTDILSAVNCDKYGLEYLEDTLSGEGDMYTAWNYLQLVLFGEVVYG